LDKAISLNYDLCVETVPYKPLIDERYADSKEVADFVKSYDNDNLSLCIDLNHSNIKEDLLEVAQNCDGSISNIHVSNNYGKQEEHLFPDDGVIDLPAAIKAIVEAGYEGPLNLECHTEKMITVELLKELYDWAQKTIDVYGL